MIHVFIECCKVTPLWQTVFLICEQNKIEITRDNISLLFSHLHVNSKHVINFVATMLKQYVYRCRCAKILPSNVGFYRELNKLQYVEFCNAKRDHSMKRHIIACAINPALSPSTVSQMLNLP